MDGDEPAGPSSVEPGVWRFEHATRARVVIDAADYFLHMQAAMLRAKKRIMLIGWDFDTRIALGRGRSWWNLRHRRSRPPRRLGAFIVWLVKRNRALSIRVLKWNFGAFKMVFRGSMMIDIWRWWRRDGIDFKFDSAHPFGCSHHQKIVIIDDRFAVCGGIDMTADRWDTRRHRDADRLRREPGGRRYDPWHDMTMMVEGDIAGALDDLGRARWHIAGGERIESLPAQPESAWPEDLEPDFEDIEIGIARTRAAWQDNPAIREIETLYLQLIERARHFIYAENQYFASRKIAEAIVKRLGEPDPPEIVLVGPLFADGWLEQEAMDTARQRLMGAIGRHDPERRFRIYTPKTAAGVPIYVHAKLMIVDDEILKIGSANMNNRSLGLDSECDLLIDATRPANAAGADRIRERIRGIRHSLLAEHTGVEEADIAGLLERHGSMREFIENHPQPGRTLELLPVREINEIERAMADGQVLDPESPEEFFEPIGKRRGLLRSRLMRRSHRG